MKKLGILLASLVTVTLVLSAIGCSSGGGGGGGGSVATPTHTVAATNTPATTPRPGASQTQTEAVSSDVLISFLPGPPSGWEAQGDGFGATFTNEGCSSSQSDAMREYLNTATDENAGVYIEDSGGCSHDPYLSTFQTFASPEYQALGVYKSVTVAGYPALRYNHVDKEISESQLFVLVADRFVVMITSDKEATVNTFSNLINYHGIAALK